MALPPRRKEKPVGKERNIGLDIYGKENVTGNNLLPAENKVRGNNLLPLEMDEIDSGLSDLKKLVDEGMNFHLTEVEELNQFLQEKSLELLKTQAKAILHLGKIFTEVEEKLGGYNRYGGVYVQWLELNGFNKMTALRHRRRYRLFTHVRTDLGKSLVGTLPQSIINDIVMKSENEIKEYVSLIDEGIKKDELSKILDGSERKNLELKKVEEAEIGNEYQLVNDMLHKISIEKLDDIEKITFEKDMKKVEKILKKYVKG